jgi:transposase
MEIKGLTIREMAEKLELPYKTIEKRLKRAGIEPLTTGTIYPESALEAIRSVPGKGRPRKQSEPEAKPETTKVKKAKK